MKLSYTSWLHLEKMLAFFRQKERFARSFRLHKRNFSRNYSLVLTFAALPTRPRR